MSSLRRREFLQVIFIFISLINVTKSLSEESSIDAEPVHKSASQSIIVSESSLHSLNDIPLSADDEINKQKQFIDISHRHSATQLEPDLAKTIFDNKASGNKNPLQRTTTIPQHRLDSGNTAPLIRGRRQSLPRSVHPNVAKIRRFQEYDMINADFNEDGNTTIIEQTETVSGGGSELSSSDILNVESTNSTEAEDIEGSFEDANSQKELSKDANSHKDVFERANKSETSALRKDGNSFESTTRDFVHDISTTRALPEESSSTTATSEATSIATSSSPNLLSTGNVASFDLKVEDVVHSLPDPFAFFADTPAPFHPVLDRTVHKKRVVLSNYVDPDIFKRRFLKRIKRADNEDMNFVKILDETNLSEDENATKIVVEAKNANLIENISVISEKTLPSESNLRGVADRASVRVLPKLVSSSFNKQSNGDSDLFKDLPSASNDKDIGLEKEVDSVTGDFFAPFPPTTTTRAANTQPTGVSQSATTLVNNASPTTPLSTTQAPRLQLNHFIVGRRRFVIKSIPMEHYIRQRQEQQFLQQQQQQQQFLPPTPQQLQAAQQALPFAQPQSISSGDVLSFSTRISNQATPPTFVNNRRPVNNIPPQQQQRSGFVRVIQTTTTRLPDIISTQTPLSKAHVKVESGDFYDELLADHLTDSPKKVAAS